MTISCVADLVLSHEGERLAAYDDLTGEPVPVGGQCLGTLTIGVGHVGTDVNPGTIWTKGKSRAIFAMDLAKAAMRASSDLGGEAWAMLDAVRQAALQDMAFELGGHGLAGFTHMLAAVRNGDWQQAHDQALASKWAAQVPERAQCDATMLLTGEWPSIG